MIDRLVFWSPKKTDTFVYLETFFYTLIFVYLFNKIIGEKINDDQQKRKNGKKVNRNSICFWNWQWLDVLAKQKSQTFPA